MPVATLTELLQAGVHFGHQTSRWNPKMRPYIFDSRGGIHIIDVSKTVGLLDAAYQFCEDTVAQGGHILFVGTKKQAQDTIVEQCQRADQLFVVHRWMGGMLTNFEVIKRQLNRLAQLREMSERGAMEELSKKQRSRLEDERDRLSRNFGGIAGMRRLPSAVFIVDPHKERLAVTEARKLRVPIIAITDSNCDPEEITYVIPGNDDAIRSVRLVVTRLMDACVRGLEQHRRIDEDRAAAELTAAAQRAEEAAAAEVAAAAQRVEEAAAAEVAAAAQRVEEAAAAEAARQAATPEPEVVAPAPEAVAPAPEAVAPPEAPPEAVSAAKGAAEA